MELFLELYFWASKELQGQCDIPDLQMNNEHVYFIEGASMVNLA